MRDPSPWVILIPLTSAGFALLLGHRSIARFGVVAAAFTTIASAFLVVDVWRHGTRRYPVGGWDAPLGIELVVDGLAALMIAMTAVVGLLISIYSFRYFSDPPDLTRLRESADVRPSIGEPWGQSRAFWPLWLFLWASINIVFLSGDMFNIYVGLEIMGVSAVALVTLSRGAVATLSATKYLIAAVIGSMLYLMGVAILYASFSTLDLQELSVRIEPGNPATVALVLMSAGLLLKTALFPLHFWLPAAHSAAPAPVSAILSALVIKASFYLFLRLWMDVFMQTTTRSGAVFVGLLATAAIIWGSLQAIRQIRLKPLIAYSTVAQVGYLFLLIPLAVPIATDSWNVSATEGGVYHAISHALAKAAMFLAAGAVMQALGGTDEIGEMAGLAARLPISAFAIGLAGVSLMGLPPSGGYVAKWLMMNAAFDTAQPWWAIIIVVGGGLTAIYMFKFIGLAFRKPVEGSSFLPSSAWLEGPAFILAVLSILVGLRATPIVELLSK